VGSVTVRYEVAGAVVTITIDRPQPQRALRADLQSLRRQGSLSRDEAMDAEFRGGKAVIDSGEAQDGARRFVEGSGRHGS
jgi:enoyl-CoA hydratase